MSGIVQDLSYALRALARRPGFSSVVILTLALGIGASTAIVSAVHPILIAPLPYPQSDRLVTLWDVDAEGKPFDVTYGTYVEVAARSRSFDALAVTARWRPSLVAADEPERLDGERVSADYFRALGMQPAIGRGFDAEDAAPGAADVAIVSTSLAARVAGTADAILRQTIRLDGAPFTVVGVMPDAFEDVLSPAAEVWAPLKYRAHAPFEAAEWGHHLRMVGRLAADVSVSGAARELAAIARTPSMDFARPQWAALESGFAVETLQASVTRGIRPVLLAILGAVLLLLVIASVNVANLLLARGVDSRREIATHAALGAAPHRIVRQRLAESIVLAALGGAAGLIVAAAGVRALVALAPPQLPRLDAVALEAPIFLFSLLITSLVGLAIGLAPALQAVRTDLRSILQTGARTIGRGQHLLRRALVATQVAIALVLLVGAGLLLRSMDRLLATAPGFDPAQVLTMQVVASGRGLESSQEALQLFVETLAAVRNVPGVTHAAYASQLPLSGDSDLYGAAFESAPLVDQRNTGGVLRYAVTPEWFQAMGIPLRQGRLLGAEDRPGGPVAIVVNESFAKRRFGDESPLGQRVRLGPQIGAPDQPWSVIVGVVGDVRHSSLALPPPDAFYVALGQWAWVDEVQSLAVRADGDPRGLVQAVKRAIWSVDPALPITRIETMAGMVSASEARRTFALTVFSAFAAASLLLATLGLYGVIAGSVAERAGEIGLRAALGATQGRILTHVVAQGMILAMAGIVAGLVAAAAATRALATLLFDVDSLDPTTYAAVVSLLLVTSAAASWLPASRAARVDPTVALRAQ